MITMLGRNDVESVVMMADDVEECQEREEREEPSQETIREACEAIRATWDSATEMSRRGILRQDDKKTRGITHKKRGRVPKTVEQERNDAERETALAVKTIARHPVPVILGDDMDEQLARLEATIDTTRESDRLYRTGLINTLLRGSRLPARLARYHIVSQ